MKKLLLLFILSGCANTIPVTQKFPLPPTDLQEPEQLEELKDNATLTDLLHVVNRNYSKYHQVSIQLSAWNKWYEQQVKQQQEK